MIYTTLFTAALAISGAGASPVGFQSHPSFPGGGPPPAHGQPHPSFPGGGHPPAHGQPHPSFPGGGHPPAHGQFHPSSLEGADTPPGGNAPPPGGNIDPFSGGKGNASSLADRFKAYGKLYFGTAVDPVILRKPGMPEWIAKIYNGVTAENTMKWDATEAKQDHFTYEQGDIVYKYIKEHKMIGRGHVLLWHKQLPQWVENIRDPATLTKVIQNHIANVMGHWPGLYSWDVVNEAFEENGQLRNTVFYRVLGEDFIRIAFDAARKADPHAKLYINDFNLDHPNSPKVKGLIAKVDKWRASGIQINGIGSQSHIGPGGGRDNAAALEVLSSAVDEVAITELDITNAPPEDYRDVVDGCLKSKKCVGVTTWGARDSDSWLASKRPLLFDAQSNPKPAFKAVMSALQEGTAK